MDGVIVVNKEQGLTSRDVVNKVSKYLGIRKIGHTGTLDPMATGVLVLVVGKATKLVEYLTSSEKEYVASMCFGKYTDTLDITGKVLKTENVSISLNQIKNVLSMYKKTYMQEVPKYSAVKVNGKKLYEYARNNEDVVLPKKEVTIKKIELLDNWENDGYKYIKFNTTVSKGTYIRSLVRDIAYSLNTIGVMTSLNRTRQGDFTLDQANTLEDIKRGKFKLIKLDEIFCDIPKIQITSDIEKSVVNGNIITNNYNTDKVLFIKDNQVIALYQKYDNNHLKPFIMF